MAAPFLSRHELARAWQIVRVFGRYGLFPLLQVAGLVRSLGIRLWRRMDPRMVDVPPPVRLRLALVELGTTFIKLGQVLSARSDLLPPAYIDELSKLQDEVPPLPFERMLPVFEAEFGMTPFEAYAAFDPMPFASASIGQVYRARLHTGEEVSVKIQRPGVLEQVRADLALLQRVADLADRNRRLQRFDLPSLVREFRAILQDELLYTLEAHNAETLAAEMADHPTVTFPEVYWPLTARQVLTTKWIDGVKITELAQLDAMGINRRELAVTLANSLLEQILVYGMFHGDPHPGNLLVTPTGIIAFLDTGMVGRFDRKTRELLIELAVSIFDQDIDAILSHLQQLGVVSYVTEMPALRRDLARLITKYYFLPRRELRLGELLQRVNNLLFEHHIRMAYEFGLMTKALFIAEGIAQELDPAFDYNEAARPVIGLIRRRYYSVESFWEDSVREFRGLRRQLVDFPRRVSAILTHLERGTIRIRLSDDLWEIKEGAENILVNRISFAVLVIGLLIAAVLLLGSQPTGWLYGVGVASLITGGVLFIILLAAVLRSGRV